MDQTQGDAKVARRHPTLDRLESALGAIARATAARSVARGGEGGLVLLPSVIWMPGPADHAKAHRGLLPYPVRWDVPLVVAVAPERSVIARWSGGAWGTHVSGEVELVCSRIAPTVCSVADLSSADRLPDRVWVGIGSAARLARHLDDVADQAAEAEWSLHAELVGWLRQSLAAAHRAVSADLQVRRCLDDGGIDELLTEIELGAPGAPGLIAKVVDRLADVTKARPSVDSARYIVTTFRRDAELALRRRVDDPRWVGTAFRSFARSNPELSGRQLIAAFNDSGCLSERIGVARAVRALHPAVAPEQVELIPERVETAEQAAERPDVVRIATALTTAFSERGGLTGAVRLIAAERPADGDERLVALAKVVGGKRTLLRLATMEEDAAASWVAYRLVEAGAA